MDGDAIFVCRDAVGSHWQHGPLPPGHGTFVLLGWKTPQSTPDAGVPSSIAAALASALTRVAMVTFPCSEFGPNPVSEQLNPASGLLTVVAAPAKTAATRFRGVFGRHPPNLVLLSTQDPASARRLFEDALHPWWLQGQFALLSDPKHQPEGLSNKHELVFRILEPDWAEVLSDLELEGVNCIVKPGVDGAVIGFLSVLKGFEDQLLTALKNESVASGIGWAELSESDFALAL